MKDFLQQCLDSILRVEFYKEAITQPVSKALFYLFLLCLFLGTIIGLKLYYDISKATSYLTESFITGSPNFTLENGKLFFAGAMPFRMETDKEFLLIVDTTGKTNEHTLDKYTRGIFISQDKLVTKKNEIETTSVDLSQLKGIIITKETVAGWLPLLKYIGLFCLAFSFIFYFLGKLCSALVLSVIGLLLGKLIKVNLPYESLLKVSLYALTLPLIFDALIFLTIGQLPFFWVLYYGIATGYIAKALLLVRDSLPKDDLPSPPLS